jgi:hypothetical protein
MGCPIVGISPLDGELFELGKAVGVVAVDNRELRSDGNDGQLLLLGVARWRRSSARRGLGSPEILDRCHTVDFGLGGEFSCCLPCLFCQPCLPPKAFFDWHLVAGRPGKGAEYES